MSRNLRLVLFATAVLCLYGSALGHTPPHLHHDEVVISLQAHSIATTGRDSSGRLLPLYFQMPLLGERVWYQPAIIYFTALFLKILPAGMPAFRFPTAVLATLDVVLMFFAARRLFTSDRWGFAAAVLLAMTPTHFMLGRVAFDFIYPLPFILGWLWALLIYLDRRESRHLFIATTVLGLGFYSYISSIAMMPVYFALTLYLLLADGELDVRRLGVAAAGFAWPLLLLIPWLVLQPTFVAGLVERYSIIGTEGAAFRFSSIAERVTLYWSFFNPAFLFLMGGFTHLTASTRLVGVFLAPFLLLIPLGLIQMVTSVRTHLSVVLAVGFFAAPLTAVLAVKDPYASSRQASIMVFGVLIAVYGIRRLINWGGVGRLVAIGVFAFLPLHFGFFVQHYFRAYHGYAAAQFEWNHEDAMAAIIARNPADNPRDVYLTATRNRYVESFWRLALAVRNREDLISRTRVFDSSKGDAIGPIPPGAFVFASTEDKALLEAAKSGQFTEIMRAPEPDDEPVFYVLQRNPD